MIKNIIFDWSGVIKDCVLNHLCVVNKIFKDFGVSEISLEELKKEWKQPHMDFYSKYLPNSTVEQIDEAYKKNFFDCPKSGPYSGIIDLIKELKKNGKKIVIFSSDYTETILPEIEEFGLKDYFDDVVVGVYDKEKSIGELIKRNNFKPEETIFIGDSIHEVEVGKKFNIMTGAVTWGYSTEERLKKVNPDFIIHNLKELKETLETK